MAAVIKGERRQMDNYSEPGLLSVGFRYLPQASAGEGRGLLKKVRMEHTPKMMTKKKCNLLF